MVYKGVIYVSTLQKNLELDDVKLMAINFSNINKVNNITGALLYSSGNIIQYIEGDSNKIDRLYSNIKKDIRHYNIITLFEEEIETKYFPDWGFKFYITSVDKLNYFKKQIDTNKRNIITLFRSFIEVNFI